MTDDLRTLAAVLGHAGDQALDLVSVAVRKTALDIQATAQAIAPVDTGNLKNSISTGATDLDRPLQPGDLDAEIGPTAEYGHFVEYGTSRMAPQAYMGPALDRHGHLFEQAVEQITDRLL